MEKVEFNSEIYYFGFVDRNEDRIVLVVGDDVEEEEARVSKWTLKDYEEQDVPYTEMTLHFTDGLADALQAWSEDNPEESIEYGYADFADELPNTIEALTKASSEVLVDIMTNLLFDLCATEWDNLILPFTVEEHGA